MPFKAPSFYQRSLLIAGLFTAFSWLSGYYAYESRRSFVENSVQTRGLVLEWVPKRKAFSPKIKFVSKKGEIISFVANKLVSDTTGLRVGDSCLVLYHPALPEYAELNDFWSLWFNSILMLGLGTLPLLGVVVLRFILAPRASDKS